MQNEDRVVFDGNAVLDTLPDPLILTDNQGCIVWLNPKAEEVFHVSCAEVQGVRFMDAIKIYKIESLIEEVLKTRAPSESSYEAATVRLEDRNLEYFFKISVTPIFQKGKLSGTLVLLSDVTRFSKLEKIKTNFVSIVSHEFRTPLASIAIGVGMLKEGLLGNLNEKGKQIVRAIEEDCDRLNNLINNLLDLSRMESGYINVETEAVDLKELVEESIRFLSLQAEAKGITITADLPPLLPPVEADFNKIIWLLTNLIGNALRYTPEGGNIRIKVKPSCNRMFISVIDTGCGIPRLYQKKIFKKFVQVKDSEAPAGGSGLGLAICQEVVEAHGGRIWVESVEGQGSTFTFTLPLSTKRKTVTNYVGGCYMGKILLVEDEKNIVLGVRTCLEAVGYHVHVVEDGEEALDYVTRHRPDLILLDLMLPKVDGFEVCRALKNNEETKDIPIIVLTARTGMEDRQRVAELGAESYMTKPFRPRELWDEIKHYLPDKKTEN